MYDFAFTVIKETAVTLGLPADAIFEELENEAAEEIMLPSTRLEIQFMDESLIRQGWRVARLKDNGDMKTRWARYRAIVSMRAVYRSDNQSGVEDFCRKFVVALPGKIRDAAGNWVRIEANRAERKNYTFATIKIEDKPVQAIHITFTGIVYKDVPTHYIEEITINSSFNGEQL